MGMANMQSNKSVIRIVSLIVAGALAVTNVQAADPATQPRVADHTYGNVPIPLRANSHNLPTDLTRPSLRRRALGHLNTVDGRRKRRRQRIENGDHPFSEAILKTEADDLN